MPTMLFDTRIFKWGEQFTKGQGNVITEEFLANPTQRPWIRPLRDALSHGQSPTQVFLDAIPSALGLRQETQRNLEGLGELAELLALVDDVFVGFSSSDLDRNNPLIGLSFVGINECYLVVAGGEVPPPSLPTEFQGLLATTGKWLDIGVGPLSNFLWFLPSENKDQVLLTNSFYPHLLARERRAQDRSLAPDLPLGKWPNPMDCRVLGQVANGDLLALVTKGELQGQIYLFAQEVPGPVNHLASKDHLTWMKWVLRSSARDANGEEWSRPWFY